MANSGRAGEVAARVGQVRSLDFLSILRNVLPSLPFPSFNIPNIATQSRRRRVTFHPKTTP